MSDHRDTISVGGGERAAVDRLGRSHPVPLCSLSAGTEGETNLEPATVGSRSITRPTRAARPLIGPLRPPRPLIGRAGRDVR